MPPKCKGRKVTDNLRQFGPASADGRPQGIQQAAPGLSANRYRQAIPLGFMDEIYDIHCYFLFISLTILYPGHWSEQTGVKTAGTNEMTTFLFPR